MASSSRPVAPSSTPAGPERIEIRGAGAHNLAGIDIDVPLRRFVCVAGVSGSGKSTLVVDVLYRAACKRLGRTTESPGEHRAIHGLDALDDVVLVDQSPIGKTTRSNPASYVGALDAIRKLFASEPVAVERGYTAGTFSFNSGNGRCPGCAGNGFEHVEMQFLSDVYLRCPDCEKSKRIGCSRSFHLISTRRSRQRRTLLQTPTPYHLINIVTIGDLVRPTIGKRNVSTLWSVFLREIVETQSDRYDRALANH